MSVVKRFAGLLKCDFKLCGELVAIGGNAGWDIGIEIDEHGHYQQSTVPYYQPTYLSPPPLPIRRVKGTPAQVQTALESAAGLLWQSPEAAANHVRHAVEHLMDSLKVKKRKSGGGSLSLHARIELFHEKDEINADLLLAVKWLGNSGSHAGGLARDDVLDAFDIIEVVLTNLFDNVTRKVLAKAKAINKARGPARKKK